MKQLSTIHMKCDWDYFIGLLNSIVANEFIKIASRLNYQIFNIINVPVKIENIFKTVIKDLVQQNISISKTDWDSFETSWTLKASNTHAQR